MNIESVVWNCYRMPSDIIYPFLNIYKTTVVDEILEVICNPALSGTAKQTLFMKDALR